MDVDPDGGRIEVAFLDGGPSFTNPFGEVLGGFVAAMLYDTVGPAVLATLSAGEFIATHELGVTFTGPATVGRFVGRGRVVRREGGIVIADATLTDATGTVVATAEASIEVVRRDPP